jgi:uncharacterized protein YdiU (UPF0061 family)
MIRNLARRHMIPVCRIAQINRHLATMENNHVRGPRLDIGGVSLAELPKSNIFTSSLPADSEFPTPASSYKATRRELGPRLVRGAIYTYVRPEDKEDAELVGVSERAMKDIGLKLGEEETDDFKDLMSGNKIMWDPKTEEGVYPWAQCYGGYQFGQWASQLGDGRAISLFESINPDTKTRYEIQLKGAGMTPYSRFADGKAVVRSSVREFIVSEALNGLKIPTTRALALTVTPKSKVRRETVETGAIVCRFAQSWLRIGSFDLLRYRGDRALIRKLATYVAENVFDGWDTLPKSELPPLADGQKAAMEADETEDNEEGQPKKFKGPFSLQPNRFTSLYRSIALRNAHTVALWQTYGFMNGVLNTDNTSILGLSLDFGPFAFLDDFDPNYTPNHDDHMLRYSYKNQPSVIWWNLVKLGEALGELIGAGDRVDEETFVTKGVDAEWAPEVIRRAEETIMRVGEDYKLTFMASYQSAMGARLGLKTIKDEDFETLMSDLLDMLKDYSLDFNHFFRRLSSVRIAQLDSQHKREDTAGMFFHQDEGAKFDDQSSGGWSNDGDKCTDGPWPATERGARYRLGEWLRKWSVRVGEDWGDSGEQEEERIRAMKAVNPKFVPRSWVLDEIIKAVEDDGGDRGRAVLKRVMKMAEDPFREEWGGDRVEEERWCGEVPRSRRMMMCSCSS